MRRVLIDFGDGIERPCTILRLAAVGFLIRSEDTGAVGYYSGPVRTNETRR